MKKTIIALFLLAAFAFIFPVLPVSAASGHLAQYGAIETTSQVNVGSEETASTTEQDGGFLEENGNTVTIAAIIIICMLLIVLL